MDAEGDLGYDDVMMFLHKDDAKEAVFMSLETEFGRRITLTPNHLIHTADTSDVPVRYVSPSYARNVQTGQYLYTMGKDLSVRVERVTDVTSKVSRGVVAPLTTRGTIVVDDVIVSCYAVIESENIAHAAFAPVRFWYSVSDWLRVSTSGQHQLVHNLTHTTSNDFHWYADLLYDIAPYVLPESWLVNS
jgi:hedgehog protein